MPGVLGSAWRLTYILAAIIDLEGEPDVDDIDLTILPSGFN